MQEATAQRLRLLEVENQWQTEVNSLKNLIEVRRKRLAPVKAEEADDSTPDAQDLFEIAEGESVSHVDWILHQVAASGIKGMSPPELLRQAEFEQRKMHQNYPYVVLRKLVKAGRVAKKNGRYFKAQ